MIAIPDLDPEAELVELQAIAEGSAGPDGPRTAGYTRRIRCARRGPPGADLPYLVDSARHRGEKPYEEFVAAGETDAPWLQGLRKIAASSNGDVGSLIARFERIREQGGTRRRSRVRFARSFRTRSTSSITAPATETSTAPIALRVGRLAVWPIGRASLPILAPSRHPTRSSSAGAARHGSMAIAAAPGEVWSQQPGTPPARPAGCVLAAGDWRPSGQTWTSRGRIGNNGRHRAEARVRS